MLTQIVNNHNACVLMCGSNKSDENERTNEGAHLREKCRHDGEKRRECMSRGEERLMRL